MDDIARKHQKRIAAQTLRMSQQGARIMGGITFAEAYRIVFGLDLSERLRQLRSDYSPETLQLPFERGGINWELDKYGHRPCEF